jgi:hypothetical protein
VAENRKGTEQVFKGQQCQEVEVGLHCTGLKGFDPSFGGFSEAVYSIGAGVKPVRIRPGFRSERMHERVRYERRKFPAHQIAQ